MTDFFTMLASRVLNQARVAEPVRRSRFEPQPGDAVLLEQAVEMETPPPLAAPELAPPRPTAAGEEGIAQQGPRIAPPREPISETEPGPPRESRIEARVIERETVRIQAAAPPPPPASEHTHSVEIHELDVHDRVVSKEVRIERHSAERFSEPREHETTVIREEERIGGKPYEHPAKEPEPQPQGPRPVPVRAVVPAPVQPAEVRERATVTPETATEPVVRVNIGRIEVRAHFPPAPQPPKRPGPQPAISLSDYLDQRRRP